MQNDPIFAKAAYANPFAVLPQHAVQFYEDQAFMAASVSNFVKAGIENGEGVILIITPTHLSAVERNLAADGIDIANDHRCVVLDASETLSSFLLDGRPDADRFEAVVGQRLRRLVAQHRHVRAFGEMVALLWEGGRQQAALELEGLWNEIGAKVSFSLLCAYPMAAFAGETEQQPFLDVCASHTRVMPTESYEALQTTDERGRAVAQLQRNTAALHAEIAAREAAQQALERSERELADFFENGPVPLHWVAVDGTILRANRAELALLGYTADEYIGHNVREFHVDQRVIADILARLGRGETLQGYEAALRRKDGAIKTVRIESNVYREQGKFVHTRCVTRDVTEEKRADEMAARLATIVESSDDAIISKTLDGVVTSWNRGAERIFGYSAAEMIGQPILRLVPQDRTDDFPRIIETLRAGRRVDHFETERIRKDGKRIHVSITVSPILDGAGRVIGASKIARDVSDRQEAEQARLRLLESERQARADAETAIRTKDEFLSVVSHELRTPLAAILGWVNVLKTGVTGDKAERAIDTIERSGRAQAKLIEDLLDVSRMVTGQMRLDLRLVDLPAVMRQAGETIAPTAQAKGVTLRVHLDPGAGPVAGDVDRLQQIAWNLLSNAVKFTPSGGTVELRLERRVDDVCLIVRDNGRGIAREFLPCIFERFRQADRADSRRGGGLGLGLAIVRHLAELHGGSVAVASPGEGLGAVFTVSLPLASRAWDYKEPDGSRPFNGLRMLVIDDDFDAQDGLRRILEVYGARVSVAGSVGEARELLRESPPDVVLSDIRLPDGDGYELVRDLRSIDRFRAIPAIAISGVDTEDSALAIGAGYDMRLRKPIDANLLVEAVSGLLRTAKQPQRPR